ncbi:MAG: Rpn family recombination-promoting nuclease/putative transposase [Cytophagales bacterium]|nr:Rpn family recombination-promoting nuclease/putative transposase [Cytophagales bacterium]
MKRFLDPKNDFAFKRIFRSRKHKKLLISFLNAVLQNQIPSPIQRLSFLKTVQDPEIASKKQSAVDVMCQDQEGTHYIVEMQLVSQEGFEESAQYYASKAYTSQMGEGDQYKDVKEVFMIMLCFVVPQNYEESLYYKKLMRMSQKQLI